MNFKHTIESICDVIIHHSLYMVDVYVFGSALKGFCDANDIDILVIGDCVDGLLLKRKLRELDLFVPVHIITMTHSEEYELGFIKSVGTSLLVVDKSVKINFVCGI
ncbi:nucleotidyltransferase domain-containing protein [Escherichia coli]|uniref:nucleotidyltransferase domain-containing protein n=1 Tax=Escherichia coli TaxID=562 RepID=UPI000B503C3B|nr:nucleotidyltransferase domain-containing protein [Escherichia coli]EEW7871082.1 nucleotidyltransferase domain-containing protein [Escherichia coli]EFL0474649.1 nucleotidyltransferase domain-containing protein [Escherichia coli]EFU8317214.1 nucleotidyltransferase domain-containing protein [Escherichia coli]EHO2041770.1 nucleotidyltransferase domain-containing protein [Escherichia coli]EJG2835550.1 nucleotidyltransferase domain-containing protein [Escherichia coli]